MNAPTDLTLRDCAALAALIGALAGRQAWPRQDAQMHTMIDECWRASEAFLAARGTPAPALDEQAIRRDEREKLDRAINAWLAVENIPDATVESLGRFMDDIK